MHREKKTVLLVSMPFAGINIPSIQLAILESYLKERDIEIKTKNLYLKAAEFLEINNYNYLIHPPNDSYLAQMAFSKYVFPNHWLKNEEKLKDYFNKNIVGNNKLKNKFAFEFYLEKTDQFYNWALEKSDWRSYDIIGFTLNYGQFLPSLAISKKIKELDPSKKIIFGGSRTTEELGKRVLETFDYIDFIVSGDGEEALYLLSHDYNNFRLIPGLIYRVGNNVVLNESENSIDLNTLSIPSYDNFFEELSLTSAEVQQYFQYSGYMPIEISRGCWWNKCSFCNLNLQYKRYREKSVNRTVEEIQYLSDKYKILNFQFIGNTLPAKDYKELFTKIIALSKDFNIVTEARADHLKNEDYRLLKEAGFNIIQTGIESFSNSYLKKMNKGTRVIDNIAALKFCKENEIINKYNLLIDYPNEELIDFEETKKVIKTIKQFLEPPQICYLRIMYGSPIFCNLDKFNISELEFTEIDKLMFPQDILEKGLCFVYSYKNNKNIDLNNWHELVNNWKIEREMLKIEGIKTQNIADKFIFYYADGGSFIKIYDKRNLNNIQIYNLNEFEREVFLSCSDIISFEKLKEKFFNNSESELKNTLIDLEENGIVFREDNFYLSLPLDYKKCVKQRNKKISYQKNISANTHII